MRLVCTKGAGKFDDLRIVRSGGAEAVVRCPKQGIIPHEMVHYAVETVISQCGFLSTVAGQGVSGAVDFDADADAIERLVESIQAELWSGRVSAEALLAQYRHACSCRGHSCFDVSGEDLGLIRIEVDRLASAWEAVPVHGSLVLDFNARG